MANVSEEAIRVKILDAKTAEKELRGVRKELEYTTGQTSSHGKAAHEAARGHEHLSRSFSATRRAVSYGAGLFGISAATYGLKDLVQGGLKAQESQALLRSALRDTGVEGAKHINQLNAAAERSSSTGGFAALEETAGLTAFIRETKNSTQAINLQREAVELARGAHLGLGQAQAVVQRIQTGQTGRLQRYLGILQPTRYHVEQLTAAEKKQYPERLKAAELADKRATAEAANVRVLERYGTATEVYSRTTQGAVSNANNAWKAATEQLGLKLLPVVTDVANGFREVVTEVQKGEGIWGTVEKDATDVWEALRSVWEYFEKNKTSLELLETALEGLAAAWAIEKVLKFAAALKELMIVQQISKAFGGLGPAAQKGATALEAESGAYSAAGAVLGEAFLYAFVAYIGLNAGKMLAKHLHVGFHPENILEGKSPFEITTVQHAAKEAPGNAAKESEWKRWETQHPFLASKQAGGLLGKESAIEKWAHSFEHPTTHHVHVDTHVHLDGKEVAHSVATHVLTDPKVARKVAEGTTKHTLELQARNGH
jgi:hypothetical protein